MGRRTAEKRTDERGKKSGCVLPHFERAYRTVQARPKRKDLNGEMLQCRLSLNVAYGAKSARGQTYIPEEVA